MNTSFVPSLRDFDQNFCSKLRYFWTQKGIFNQINFQQFSSPKGGEFDQIHAKKFKFCTLPLPSSPFKHWYLHHCWQQTMVVNFWSKTYPHSCDHFPVQVPVFFIRETITLHWESWTDKIFWVPILYPNMTTFPSWALTGLSLRDGGRGFPPATFEEK